MIGRLLIALALLAMPSALAAQPAASPAATAQAGSLEGSWALRLDGAILFRFDLERDGANWRGAWTRPRSFASDGDRFSHPVGAMTLVSAKGGAIGEWAELTFADDRPGAVPDVFRFHLLGRDRAEMIYAGTGLAPYTLERVAKDALLGPFEEGKIYRRPGMAAVATRPAPAPSRGPAAEPEAEVQGPPAMEGR